MVLAAGEAGDIIKSTGTELEAQPDVTAAVAVSIKHITFDDSTGTLTFVKENGEVILAQGLPTDTNAPEGEKGKQGLEGPRGRNGRPGKDGRPGDQGCPGRKGDRGMMGPTGHTGPIGVTGNTGSIGPTGNTGPVGATGERGEEPEYRTIPNPDGGLDIGGLELVIGTGRKTQWGRYRDDGTSAVADVRFHEAFERVCSGFFVFFRNGSDIQAQEYTIDENQITLEAALVHVDLPVPLADTWDFYWMAIGD